MWRNQYAKVNGERQDIIKDGQLACAFYVSTILVMFGLIKELHATVNGTVKDLEASGWKKVKKPKPGAVLAWEAITFDDGSVHKHIGFYIGQERAVSNSAEQGIPVEHDWLFNGSRKIETIYWHQKLRPT